MYVLFGMDNSKCEHCKKPITHEQIELKENEEGKMEIIKHIKETLMYTIVVKGHKKAFKTHVKCKDKLLKKIEKVELFQYFKKSKNGKANKTGN